MPAGQAISVGEQTSQYLPLDFTDNMQDVGGVTEVETLTFPCFTPVLASIRLDDSDDDWELGPLDDDDRHTSWDDDAEPNALHPCISQTSLFAGLNDMDDPGTFVSR